MTGWYKMHRGWMDDSIFASEPFCKRAAWEYLIHEAAFEDHGQWFNGKLISVKRGQFVVSERKLATVWQWDRQRVRTFLKQLERDEKLTRSETHGLTQLTICNYSKYQLSEPSVKPSNKPTTNPELTQSQPTTEERKEGKEGKEGKKVDTARASRLAPDWKLPSEWLAFATAEKGWSEADALAEANEFRDYWVAQSGSKGVKADWQATWRNWVRRSYRKPTRGSVSGDTPDLIRRLTIEAMRAAKDSQQ